VSYISHIISYRYIHQRFPKKKQKNKSAKLKETEPFSVKQNERNGTIIIIGNGSSLSGQSGGREEVCVDLRPTYSSSYKTQKRTQQTGS